MRRGREAGCWVYIPAAELRRAGFSKGDPEPLYRLWGRARGSILLRLYRTPGVFVPSRFELVDAVSRETEGYFPSYGEAVEFGLGGEPGTLFEVWTVADDMERTRMVLHGRHRVRDPLA